MKNIPDLHLEEDLMEQGFKYVIGVDEVGRGSLSGPVVTAAVNIPDGFDVSKINDSKKISYKKREELFERITAVCPYVITAASNKLVDEVNIREATKMAMKQAITDMDSADFVLVDGDFVPDGLTIHSRPVIKGDSISISIATASIVAKVFRDKVMEILHEDYPVYNWKNNKGYGTKEHREALKLHGPCKYHRITFKLL